MKKLSRTLELLLAKFDGQVLIPFAIGTKVAGIPEKTARNRLSNGTYPIKTVWDGTRRFIHIDELANYIESLLDKPQRMRLPGTPKSQAGARGAQA